MDTAFSQLLSWNISIFTYSAVGNTFGSAAFLAVLFFGVWLESYMRQAYYIDPVIRRNYYSFKVATMIFVALIGGYKPLSQDIAAAGLVGLTYAVHKLLIYNHALEPRTELPLIICLAIALILQFC